MEFVHQCSKTGLQANLIRGLGSNREQAEREVIEAGVPLPFWHRTVWAANASRWEPLFLLVRDADGRARAGVAIEKVAMRALPGHVLLRVRRFGSGLPDDVCRAALEALASFAVQEPRVLRLQVNIFSKDRLDAIGSVLEELQFRKVRPPSSYSHTLVVDLKPTEDQIFASFSKDGRKKIRDSMKLSPRSLAISDPVYAARIMELQGEALNRTGGNIEGENWQAIFRLSKEHPSLSYVAGLFVGEEAAPAQMGAFGWACNHGDHVEFRSAGTTRQIDVRVHCGYLIAWEMIKWAKALGVEWFDMGGVTLAEGGEPELEGISRFKRNFSRDVAEVGAEWILEPAPVRARIAAIVSNSKDSIRAWMKKEA